MGSRWKHSGNTVELELPTLILSPQTSVNPPTNTPQILQILLHNPVQCTNSNVRSGYMSGYEWLWAISFASDDCCSHCSHGRMSCRNRAGSPSSSRRALIMASQCSGSMFQPFFIRRSKSNTHVPVVQPLPSIPVPFTKSLTLLGSIISGRPPRRRRRNMNELITNIRHRALIFFSAEYRCSRV